MKNAKLNWVRLPIDNIENCRELGGYSTDKGQQTKWHAFLRSSDLSKISQEDIEFLKEYGVSTVIDLRRKDEIEKSRNLLGDVDSIDYHNISFITESVADITKLKGTEEISMGDFYIELLKQRPTVKEIFQTIYHAKDGTILFNCQVGKDRTGVLAMLLFGIAGVEKKDIISNYEVSFTNLESLQKLLVQFKQLSSNLFLSNREDIIKAYDHIMTAYGNFNDYLRACGVTQEVIDGVKTRLVDDYQESRFKVTGN
ncbi:tyrosine-protein phosphatase [Oceanobacillus bengalensis]|nr:tyrosine-protein phosphatase [Oceanobacillus bengalensis]